VRESHSRNTALSAVVLFCAVFSSLCLALGSARAESWLLAEQDDQEIRRILGQVLPIAEQQLESLDADVALVYRQLVLEAGLGSYREYLNDVWWVRRGEAESITNYVRDFAPGEKLKQARAFLIRPGRFDRQAALQAAIALLENQRIRIQEGDGKDRLANLVIGFETARPGDLLGISIQLEVEETLEWRPWLVAEHEPVARAELRIKSDPYLAYTVAGHRFREGGVQKEVIDENDGNIRDLRVWVDAVDPILDEPYSPPPHIQSPGFLVAWRAHRIDMGGGKWTWWYNRTWNQVASSMAEVESGFLEKRKRAAEQAEAIARDLQVSEAAAALYLFVRDELLSLENRYFSRSEDPPKVDKILEARAGSIIEKAYLLLAMLRSRGVQADLVWAHHPDRGGFFEQYPLWEQVQDPLIRVADGGQTRWYDLGCRECSPGTVRPRFIGARAVSYRIDSAELNEKLVDEVIEEAYTRHVMPFNLYLRSVEQQNWYEVFEIPGDRNRVVGWMEERIHFEEPTGTSAVALLQLRSAGLSPLREEVVSSGDPGTAARDWARGRFAIAQEESVLAASAAGADTLDVALRLECPPIDAPLGDTWILPAEVVYGEPTIGPWPAHRVTPFEVGHSNERRWEFRIPLPSGWEGAEVPADRVLGFKLMRYQVTFRIIDGEFVVHRTLVEKVGSVDDPASIDLIGKQASAIHELEKSAVVLHRTGG